MSQTIDRRRFISNVAVGGAAVGLRGSTVRATGSESPSDKVVVGVMGLQQGRRLAILFAQQPNVEVRYVCDVDSTRAKSCAEHVANGVRKKPDAITDFRFILDDKQVDALVCAAPNHWHTPATIFACSANTSMWKSRVAITRARAN